MRLDAERMAARRRRRQFEARIMQGVMASALGILKEAGHHETLNLKKLRNLATSNGFTIAEAKHFMFSPIGFPAEKTIEKIFGPLGLRLVMANQLLVARRG